MRYHQAVHEVPLLMEGCDSVEQSDDLNVRDLLPDELVRSSLKLPDLPEREVMKHFVNLSQMNFGV
ncbi:MAG: aminomethyl-transferring glycine dehydrogenase subunit GcvPB, partial [Candidatus Thermoplasmatota archaeon]|nr:aminomethyl-transferring glycine dehydrogenase subunit GcvPB [Candidatus Thermoplasmatota archaeon]